MTTLLALALVLAAGPAAAHHGPSAYASIDVAWTYDLRVVVPLYGSATWLLLGLHATHIITDLGDTLVLTALMFTRHAHGKRLSDVEDNAFYWYFVVATWVPMYVLIYWVPRW